MQDKKKYWNRSKLFSICALVDKSFRNETCDNLLEKIDIIKINPEKYKEVKLTKLDYKDSYFNSFQFNFKDSHNFFDDFIFSFNFLLSLYIKNGFNSPWETIEECHNSFIDNNYFLNPLIFEYRCPANFDWHIHKPKFQKFQLVMNLTKKNRDYESSLFEIMKDNQTSWKISDAHVQGSVISFPYGKPHRVTNINPINKSKTIQRHVHLLMPIHPKKGFEGSFEHLSKFNQKKFPLNAYLN